MKKISLIFISALLITSCSSMFDKKAVSMQTTIHSANYLNPSVDGKSSPVVLTIYQLRSDSQFANEDFYALYNNPQQTLGSALIDKEQIELRPDERKTLSINLAEDTKYIGVIAAFRDLNNSQWRTVMPVKQSGGISLLKKTRLTLDVGTQSLKANLS